MKKTMIKILALLLSLTMIVIFATSCLETDDITVQTVKGQDGKDGTDGKDGKDGKDGSTPVITIGEDGLWYIDGVCTGVDATGVKGSVGEVGASGANGKDGNGILSVEKTGTQGLVDTYTIKFTNGTKTTFTVTNGATGATGEDGAAGKDGEDGNGILSVEKTGTEGLVDTYTIYFTDGTHTTFTVTNGAKGNGGVDGADGEDGKDGKDGQNGKDGAEGKDGTDGKSAFELFQAQYPSYKGTEAEWIYDVITGDVCSLVGHAWNDGVVSPTATGFALGDKIYTCSLCHNTKTMPSGEMYTIGTKQYVNLGTFPQTHVSDAATVTALAALTETNARGYYEYEGKEYAKVTASPSTGSGNPTTYSDSVTVTSGQDEYFLVESIAWRVIKDEGEGVYHLLSEKLLAPVAYCNTIEDRTVGDVTVYPNNYAQSDVRTWLNGSFLYSGFTEAETAKILVTTVDNSAATTIDSNNVYACENTNDRVFLLSYAEANSAALGFSGNADRIACGTDYLLASGGTMAAGYKASWWLRSPYSTQKELISYVGTDGKFFHTESSWNVVTFQVRPSIRINLGE